MSIYVEIHSITPLGPNCINRGEDGSPKTSYLGGTLRQRVSSQSLKRAVRDRFNEEGIPVSVRSRLYMSQVKNHLVELCPALAEEADALVAALFAGKPFTAQTDEKKIATATYSDVTLRSLAEYIAEHPDQFRIAPSTDEQSKKAPEPIEKRDTKALTALTKDKSGVTLDMALFGRMMASNKDLNIYAASQFSHAIGVGPMQREYDFFSAVDDLNADDGGASMIGEIEYASSTVYRYANLNVDHLASNLGVDKSEVASVVRAFVEATILSLPTGRQNAFAALDAPYHIRVIVRDTAPQKHGQAFSKGYTTAEEAAEAFEEYIAKYERVYGIQPILSVSAGMHTGTEVSALLDAVEGAI